MRGDSEFPRFTKWCILFLCVLALMSNPSSSQQLRIGRRLTALQQRHLEEQQMSHVETFYSEEGEGKRRSLVDAIPAGYVFENDRLKNAYIALQVWKKVIFSDPKNYTATWVGPDVCSYKGIFCADAPDDSCDTTVGGVDFNHADLAGFLPEELGLLTDLALFHLNSNRFCGILPLSFNKLQLLYELDLSNNRFVGAFPSVVLSLSSLHYLDIRFNEFEGELPSELFGKNLDAIFVNNNRFVKGIPLNLGSSPVSVVVFANNKFSGCIPPSIGNMGPNLNEIILLNNELTGCINPNIGELRNLTVFDVSFNQLSGELPTTIAEMASLEQLDVAVNMFTGDIPPEICALPNLKNFTYYDNLFTGEAPNCLALPALGVSINDRLNCIPGRPAQKPFKECAASLSHIKSCDQFVCGPPPAPPSPHLPPSPTTSGITPTPSPPTSPPPPRTCPNKHNNPPHSTPSAPEPTPSGSSPVIIPPPFTPTPSPSGTSPVIVAPPVSSGPSPLKSPFPPPQASSSPSPVVSSSPPPPPVHTQNPPSTYPPPPPPPPSDDFSPNFSSHHGYFRSPLAMAFANKRDWLSSLPRSSSSTSLSTSPHTSIPSSPPLSSFVHQHSLITSPSRNSQFACEKRVLRTSLSTSNLESCKTLPSSLQLRDTPPISLAVPAITNRVPFMQGKEPGGCDCSKIHSGDELQPELQGSMESTTGYRAVLRLSDVIAAMQAKSSDSAMMQTKPSHSSSGANASLNTRHHAINSSNSPSISANPHTSTIDGVNKPALIQSCEVNIVAKTLTNADELLNPIYNSAQMAGPKPQNSRGGESKKIKRIGKLESSSSLSKVDVPSAGAMQNAKKALDVGSMGEPASKREVHINSERERRRGMTHLYATLHSLLPKGKMKADRCSVLTETMDYIQSLLEKLDELGKQKVEVLASMQQGKTEKNALQSITTEFNKGINLSVYGGSNAATSSKILIKCDSEEDISAKTRASSSTTVVNCGSAETDSTNHANASISENRTEMTMSNKSTETWELSKRALGGSSEDNSENGDKSAVRSQGGKGEVGVRLFGDDAFITVRTSKKRGAWSGMLEVLQQLGIHILNVTLSASPDSDHHCIHAKVPSGCKLNSCVVIQSLKAFVGEAQKG
eukprot:c24241_g2_i1 orf=312-3710(-)